MHLILQTFLQSCLLGLALSQAPTDYKLLGNFSGYILLDQFDFMTGTYLSDASLSVNVDRVKAQQLNMYNFTEDGTVYLGADKALPFGAAGPNSFRMESKGVYNQGLFIFDIAHAPTGCGTWPAIWMYGDRFPLNGEIDIFENVNDETTNLISLKTLDGCTQMPLIRNQSAIVKSNNCNLNSTDIDPTSQKMQFAQEGCQTRSSTNSQYGPQFNAAGGGMYAMKWDSQGIVFWFWQRGAANWPADIVASKPNPSSWGIPESNFTFTACDRCLIYDVKLVIDLYFCGRFAGEQNIWDRTCKASTGQPTCADHMIKNSEKALKDAFFSINYMSVYEIPAADAFPICPASRAPGMYPPVILTNPKYTQPNGNPIKGTGNKPFANGNDGNKNTGSSAKGSGAVGVRVGAFFEVAIGVIALLL